MRVMTVQRVRTVYVLPPKFFFSGISIGMASILSMRMVENLVRPTTVPRRQPGRQSPAGRDRVRLSSRRAEDSLTELLDTLLTELERFGKANDGATTERPRRMLNITRDTGEFLAVLIRDTMAPGGLEIGTSNGYSTT